MTTGPKAKAARKSKGKPDCLDIQTLMNAAHEDLSVDLEFTIYIDLVGDVIVECATAYVHLHGSKEYFNAWRRVGAANADLLSIMLQAGHEVYHAVDYAVAQHLKALG